MAKTTSSSGNHVKKRFGRLGSWTPIDMHPTDDTIVAIATPLGVGGLGVVRLSGPSSLAIASKLFSSPALSLTDAKTHTLHHGWIKNGARTLDEGVAAVFRAPRSYTGEDVVEFSCHGSPALLKTIVRSCQEKGARLANPGEFTQRAYLNGKIDLLQAEAVAQLIHAQSKAALLAANDQLQGTLSKRVQTLRQRLVDLLAHLEANLDFVEEDIPGLSKQRFYETLRAIQNKLDELLSTSVRGRMLREGVRVALVGKPNVGKSSLFNALLAQERAIVTDIPGTTRDTLEEQIQWNALSVILMDTAGLRTTNDKIEEKGMERTKQAQERADVILFVVDGSEPLTEEDHRIAKAASLQRTIGVLNKSDKNLKVSPRYFQSQLGFNEVVVVSAKENAGLSTLKDAVMKSVERETPSLEGIPVVTNLRHLHHLEKASEKIKALLSNASLETSEETLSLDLRDALEELSAMTGDSLSDDVLAAIFRQFCVGK